jgi:hypothetical protein
VPSRAGQGAERAAISFMPDKERKKSLHCADHHPFRIRDERGRQVTASPLMTNSWGPSWGKQLPGERRRETAET